MAKCVLFSSICSSNSKTITQTAFISPSPIPIPIPSLILPRYPNPPPRIINTVSRFRLWASITDSSSSDFVRRTERAWLISQQPSPVVCSSCNSKGHIECKWCRGTGFFILGDNMLCEVPSRNTSCKICAGKGSTCCSHCQGTGFRAKWLEEPPTS